MNQKGKRGNKESQEAKRLRLLVAAYLKKKTGTHKEAASIFQLTKSAVDKISVRYRLNGKRGLSAKKRGVKGGKN